MGKKRNFVIGIGVVAILALLAGVYFGSANSTGNITTTISQPNNPNSFVGKIVGESLPAEAFTGLNVLSDRGCTTDPQTQLSNCTSQIQTPNGIVSFNYEHNMMVKPCLSQGDIASLTINSDGTAVATRTFWSGKGGA